MALIFNLTAFAIIGLSGILLNIILVRSYDTATLGLFNQFLACYFIFSQLTTFGIHQSVLAYTPFSKRKHTILSSALFLVFMISIILSALICFSLKQAILFFKIPGLIDSIGYLFPVLILFSLNKVILFSLNGAGNMIQFAIANAFRLIMMLVGLIFHHYWQFPSHTIPALFIGSEAALLLLLLIFTRKKIRRRQSLPFFLFWAKKHVSFGKYALMSGFILDLNSKIGILILSLFVSQAEIGVYSFSALLAEGFYQLLMVFKNLNVEHMALTLQQEKSCLSFTKSQRLYRQTVFIWGVGLFSLFMYQPFVKIISNDPELVSIGWFVYSIYTAAIMIGAKWLILDNLLILNKRPKLDNVMRLTSLTVNATFAFILARSFGVIGSAIGIFMGILTTAGLLWYFSYQLDKEKV